MQYNLFNLFKICACGLRDILLLKDNIDDFRNNKFILQADLHSSIVDF